MNIYRLGPLIQPKVIVLDKKSKIILTFMILSLASCYDETEPVENTSSVEREIIYDGLTARRTDDVVYELNNEYPGVNISQRWSKAMYSRASVRIVHYCNLEQLDSVGNGFSSGGYGVLTADHVTKNPCPPGKEHLIEVIYAEDRNTVLGSGTSLDPYVLNHIDTIPPNLWLMRNRLHSLSMFELFHPVIKTEMLYEYFDNLFIVELGGVMKYFGVIKPNIDMIEHVDKGFEFPFKFVPQDPSQGETDPSKYDFKLRTVYMNVLLDHIPSPDNDTQYLKKESGQEVFTVSTYHDPDAQPTSLANLYSSSSGDWSEYSVAVQSPIEFLTQRIPFSKLISDGETFNLDSTEGFSQNCKLNEYEPYCFDSSIDALAGMSGSPVLRHTSSSGQARLVGMIVGGVTSNGSWYNSPVQSTVNSITHEESTHSITIDSVLQGARNNLNTKPLKPGKSGDFPEDLTPCAGDCPSGGSDDEGKMRLYACAKAFNEPNTGNDWSDNWSRAYGVGFVGSTMDISEEKYLGTFGIVCNQYYTGENPSQDNPINWANMKTIGQNKTDRLRYLPNILGGNDLEEVIQNTVYSKTYKNTDGEIKTINKPIPMKICPLDSHLVGASFSIKENGKVESLHAILCEREGIRANFYLNPFFYRENTDNYDDGFKQEIGEQKDSNDLNISSISCPQGKRVEGVWMYRKYSTSANEAHNTSGLRFECR